MSVSQVKPRSLTSSHPPAPSSLPVSLTSALCVTVNLFHVENANWNLNLVDFGVTDETFTFELRGFLIDRGS